ncbi:uncharacterized protein [Nicotiana tomentosiformis]|uniref:uncharacterized protein n=1 Tax=Nicotiana tomentosiformis TaxID=4098 RepID=UPI00388CC1A3
MADNEHKRLERFGRLRPPSFSGAESENAQGFLDKCQQMLRIPVLGLLIRQAQSDWETRDIKLIPYRQCVEDLSKRFKSIEFRPKANGAVEAANKNIKNILRKMVQGSRQWQEKLPFSLLGYRATVRTSVGAAPYLLVYGTEAVIPAEVEIFSLRIIVEAGIEDTDWVKSRLEQLSLIDKKCLAAVCFGQLYQQRMARLF